MAEPSGQGRGRLDHRLGHGAVPIHIEFAHGPQRGDGGDHGPGVVEDRGAEAVDPRREAAAGPGNAVAADLGEVLLELPPQRGDGHLGRIRGGSQFRVEHLLEEGRATVGTEGTARGRVVQGQDGAGAQSDGDRSAGIDDADNGGALITPHGQGDGFVDLLAQFLEDGAGQTHHVEPAEAGEPQFEGVGAQIVAATGAVLFHQIHAHETDHIAVGLGGRHAGLGSDVAQHHRAVGSRQRPQQAKTDFDGLYALSVLGNLGGHGAFLREFPHILRNPQKPCR